MKRKLHIFTCIATTMFLAGCSSTPNQNQISTAATTNSETTVVETASETTTIEETTTASSSLNLGESATLGDWEITVTNMELLDSIPNSYGSFNPDSGNKFLVVSVTVTNNGKTADSFLPSFSFGEDVNAKVLYSDGYEFSATRLLAYDKDLHDKTLNPLSSVDGEIAFQVPEIVSSSTEEPLTLHFSAGKNSFDVKLR